MDLTCNEREAAFRAERRAWLAGNAPTEEPTGDGDAHYAWRHAFQRHLTEAGYAAVQWPPEYGGRGATLSESAIFFEELARSGAPLPANVLDILLAGPTIMTSGTAEQKDRYLAPILTAEEIWCQGFSEPDAGSDLASLKTRAVKDGDCWVITGQKVWTSGTQHATWSMLFPLRQITGAPGSRTPTCSAALLWHELVELGWPGIAVAEAHGGQGLGAVVLGVLLEELGYACAATPFLSTATAAAAIQAAGTPEQKARWLPGLAMDEVTGGFGTRELAADAAEAAVVLLLDGDDAVLVTAADADVTPMAMTDGTRRFETGDGDGEPLGAGAADRVRAAIAAEVVGVCQRALEMTLAYVKQRKQFGVPVGSFQAVPHRCAQMLPQTESARSTALHAAWAADAAPDRLPEAAALTAAAAADAGREVTGSAIRAHGGIGFTWEADVGRLVAAPVGS